jgi:phosphoglycolate phosphatase
MTRAVLFDLDGTLVESAPGILETFKWVFEKHGIRAVREIDTSVIGPPLRETIRRLTGIEDAPTIEKLADSFRGQYDTTAVAETAAYHGYDETLDAVRAMGFALFIVTNKRIVPTRAIVARLGRGDRYSGIYSPDAHQPPLPDKIAVLADVVKRHGIDPARSAMIGDSAEDGAAAAASGMPFIAALYGYGKPETGGHPVAASIAALTDLPARLAALAL